MADPLRSVVERRAELVVGATDGYDQAIALVSEQLPGYVADLVGAGLLAASVEPVPEAGKRTGGRTRGLWKFTSTPLLAWEPYSPTMVVGVMMGSEKLVVSSQPYPFRWRLTGGGISDEILDAANFRRALATVLEAL